MHFITTTPLYYRLTDTCVYKDHIFGGIKLNIVKNLNYLQYVVHMYMIECYIFHARSCFRLRVWKILFREL